MDMQNIVDALNHASRVERSKYHLTLGELTTALYREGTGPSLPVKIIGDAVENKQGHLYPGMASSYRGYFSDLAFAPRVTPITVGEFQKVCDKALCRTFEGYKGGDYVMDAGTPLWISDYGAASCHAITSHFVVEGNGFYLTTKRIADY